MAGGGRFIFMEAASDDDSISVTSTVASAERDEYAVETVLSEKLDEEGIAYYLIKWEGYPLHASTWEPLENIASDEVLEAWQAKQDMVRRGQESPFDLNAFYEAEQEARVKAEEKAARRQAKRERLGTVVLAPGSRSPSAPRASNNDAPTSEDEPLARKGRKVSPPKRKGVARPVKKSLDRKPTMAAEASSSSEENSDVEVSKYRSASEDSLMEDLQAQAKKKAPQTKGTSSIKSPSIQMARASLSDASGRKKRGSGVEAPTKKSTTGEVPAKAGLATKKPAVPKAASTTAVPTSGAARKSAPSTVARTKAVPSVAQGSATTIRPPLKTATSGGKRVSTGNVDIFGNWDRTPEKRKRKSMGEDVPLDTQGKRMAKNLQHQNRIKKKSARDSVPPDISGLATFDPALGRMVQPRRPSMATADAASPTAAGASSAAFSAAPSVASPAAPTPPLALTAPMRSSTSVELPIQNRQTASPEKTSASTSAPPQAQKSVPVPAAQMVQLEHRLEGPLQPESAIHRAFGRRGTPPAERPRSVSPAREPQERYGPPSSFNHTPQNEKLVTCRKWANGYCNYSDQDCWFAHYHISEEESKRIGRVKAAGAAYLRHTQQSNSVQDQQLVPPPPPPSQSLAKFMGKVARKDITCYFWRRDGQCKKGTYCHFAHLDTGLYTEGPSTKRIWSSSMKDPTSQQPQRTVSSASPLESSTKAGNLGDEGEPMILDTDEDPSMGRVASPLAAPGSDVPPPPPPLTHTQTALSAFKHDVAISIATAGENSASTGIAVALHCDSQQHLYLLKQAMGSYTVLELQSFVGAADLQAYGAELLQQNPSYLIAGDVATVDFDDSSLATFAETCRLQIACGAIVSPDFTLLVFPSNAEEWDFLDRPNDVPGLQTALRFKLLSQRGASKKLQQPSANLPAADISSSDASNLAAGRHLLNLDANALLTAFGSKTAETRIEKVLIVMPPSRKAEMEVLRRFFEASGCEVYTSVHIETCRKYWKDLGRLCLTVLHPSIPLDRIPRLGEFLNSHLHEGIQMLSAGSVPAVPDGASGSSGGYISRFKCQRLFPAAEITLITDDVFIHYPEKAILIVEQLAKANDRSQLPLKSKLATRPGLKDWLMQLAIDRTQSGDRRDERWMKLWVAVNTHLRPHSRDDTFSIGQPGDQSNLISGPTDELPVFQDLLQRDEGQAADYLANWFAGFCLVHKNNFRRFSICNETLSSGEQILDKDFRTIIKPGETDPRGWAKEYQHLVVCLPSHWLRMLKQRKY